MKPAIREAAVKLVRALDMPVGAVNAAMSIDSKGPMIRLLVAPGYHLKPGQVPHEVDGYRVKVERRQDFFQLSGFSPQ